MRLPGGAATAATDPSAASNSPRTPAFPPPPSGPVGRSPTPTSRKRRQRLPHPLRWHYGVRHPRLDHIKSQSYTKEGVRREALVFGYLNEPDVIDVLSHGVYRSGVR